MRLIIFGDSHVVALGRAIPDLNPVERNVYPGEIRVGKVMPFNHSLRDFFVVRGDEIRFGDAPHRKQISKLFGREVIGQDSRDSILALSMPFTTTLVLRNGTWNSHSPWSVTDHSNKQLVSHAVLYEIALAHFAAVLRFVTALQSIDLRLMVVAAPPPRATDSKIARWNPEVILRVDELTRGVIANELEQRAVPVVEPPDEVFQQPGRRGFLRSEYGDDRDDHHGNAEYGRLMLLRVMALAASMLQHNGGSA
jgi:hypothetical protein